MDFSLSLGRDSVSSLTSLSVYDAVVKRHYWSRVLRFVRLQAHDIVERRHSPSQRGRWELFLMYGVEGVYASS